jgi:hypothetical protein
MTIKDKIYGEIKITDLVLIKLLKSPSLLRLKKMSNYGIPDKYYHYKGFSRYEHSVGVMILLRRLGATLEEQVVGLIHDVSHLAFSHIADWVFAGGGNEGNNEDLQDMILEKFIKGTEISKILGEFNFSLKRTLDKENFGLLEKTIPDLCADRIDYALRELRCSCGFELKRLKNYLKKLINLNGEIVFIDRKTAFDFAKDFLQLQIEHWGGYEDAVRYYLFPKALKIALRKKMIFKKDFFKDEEFILKKLEESNDEEIKETLNLLRKKKIGKIKRGSQKKIYKKFRYVDPKIIIDGSLIRLSKINPKFQKMVDRHREINKKGFIV